MKRLGVFTLPFILLVLGATGRADSEPQKLFFESVAAYNKEDFPRAKELLDQYLALRPDDAHAHLNLATVEGKLKNWGFALGHLRRAQTLDPEAEGLRDVAHWLKQGAPAGNGLSGPFHRMIRPTLASLSPWYILILCVAAFTFFGHLYITHIKKKRWAENSAEPLPRMSWIIPLMGTVFLLSLALLGSVAWVKRMDLATVTATTTLYSAPDNQSFEIGNFPEASEVKILAESGDWLQISNENGLSGWAAKRDVLTHKGRKP